MEFWCTLWYFIRLYSEPGVGNEQCFLYRSKFTSERLNTKKIRIYGIIMQSFQSSLTLWLSVPCSLPLSPKNQKKKVKTEAVFMNRNPIMSNVEHLTIVTQTRFCTPNRNFSDILVERLKKKIFFWMDSEIMFEHFIMQVEYFFWLFFFYEAGMSHIYSCTSHEHGKHGYTVVRHGFGMDRKRLPMYFTPIKKQ